MFCDALEKVWPCSLSTQNIRRRRFYNTWDGQRFPFPQGPKATPGSNYVWSVHLQNSWAEAIVEGRLWTSSRTRFSIGNANKSPLNCQKAGEHTDPSGAGVLPTQGRQHPTKFQAEQGFCQHEKQSSSETPGCTLIQVEQGFCQHEDERFLLSLKWSRGSANSRGKAAVASSFQFVACLS